MMIRVLYLYTGKRITGALESLLALALNLPPDSYQVAIATDYVPLLKDRLEGKGVQLFQVRTRTFSRISEGVQLHNAGAGAHTEPRIQPLKDFIKLLVFFPEQVRVMRRLRAQFQPDILHLNGSALISAGAAGRLLGIPVIWHVREMLGSDLWGRAAGRLLPRLAQQVVCVSEGTADRLDNSRGNIQVVYDSIYLDDFQPRPPDPAARHEFDIPDSAQVVGYVGRIIPPKGLSELVEAAPLILAQAPLVHFLLVGGWQADYKQQLEERIAALGLADRFHFAGERQDIARLYTAMDVVTLPSWSEGLGRVVIEALAMEKPMVASRLGPIAEMITDEVNGLLVAPRSPDQLAQGILRFLLTPEFARACAAAGRNVVVDRFRTDAYVRRMLQVYGKILLQGRAIRGKPLVRPRADED